MKNNIKKIVYIVNARIPTEKAHGIQIMKMCEAFSNAGNEVLLIVPWRLNRIKKNPFEYYGIKKNFKIKRFPCIDLIPLDFILNGFALWIQKSTFFIFAKLYLLFKKYNILYTRERFAGFLFKDFVLETHSLPKKIRKIHKKSWKKAKKIIVLTKFLKKELVTVGVSKNKILVAPDGVSLGDFNISETKNQCRKKFNLPLNKKVVLYSGHLYPWKGVDSLIQAIRFLSGNILLVLVGGRSPDLKVYKAKITNLKLKNVWIVGQRPHKEIPYWLKSADCLVLTGNSKQKISKYFTSPLKMFEYMASKNLIIASNLPSFGEILNSKNSILARPDNTKSLAQAINFALKNPDFCAKISEQAYKDVQSLTWDKRVKKILNFIENEKSIK